MQRFLPTIVLRHRKEKVKKCSLHGLEDRKDFCFYRYPVSTLPDLSRYVMLSFDGPQLTAADQQYGLFLLDGTWKLTEKMKQFVLAQQTPIMRTLPSYYRTAYPRRQTECNEPNRGLASIEAIYIAYRIFGLEADDLLQNYHWKDEFLQNNGLHLRA